VDLHHLRLGHDMLAHIVSRVRLRVHRKRTATCQRSAAGGWT
jgi:hypothetical protein